MPRILFNIITIILLTLTFSCRNASQEKHIINQLDRAEAIVDIRPDSALAILHDIEADAHKLARTNYITGCAKLRMQNFPDAMWSFLHAERTSQREEDYALLTLARLKMMELCDSLYDREGKMHYATSAARAYEQYLASPQSKDRPTLNIDIKKIIDSGNSLSLRANSIEPSTGTTNAKFVPIIYDDDNWDGTMPTDSIMLSVSDLHTILHGLWEKGDDTTAQRFLNCYMHSYDHNVSTLLTHDDSSPDIMKSRMFVNQILTRRHIMESFQRETSYAVAKFNYGENLLKDQALRLHKIHLWLSISLIIVLLIAIFLIIRLNRSQRLRREEESMRTALELQTALSDSENRCLSTLTHLCNTYYEGVARESVKSKAAKEALDAIEDFADSPEFFSYLEERLNLESNGIMTRLRTDIPDIKESDYRLYMCNALGLSIPTICLLLKERREVIYNRRLRLRSKIQSLELADKDTYLDYLR